MELQYNITYREKDGGWQYIISYKEGGKWKQRSKQGFRTRRAAKKAADIRLDELKRTADVSPSNLEYEGITFGEFAEMFVEHYRLYNEWNTVATLERAITKFEVLNELEMKKITTLHVQSCVDDMVREELKPSTIKLYTTHIKTVFGEAARKYGILRNSPADGVTIPAIPKDEKVRALTSRELSDLLSKLSGEYYIITLVAATTGLRIGEILGLTWSDINLDKGIITVDKQWKRLKGGEYGFGTVKSKNSNRSVPIPQITLAELRKYKKAQVPNIQGRVFFHPSTSITRSALNRFYKKNGYDVSIHDMRHTYATRLLENGVDVKTVAKLLGHSTEMTIRTYTHVTSEMLERVAQKIDSIF